MIDIEAIQTRSGPHLKPCPECEAALQDASAREHALRDLLQRHGADTTPNKAADMAALRAERLRDRVRELESENADLRARLAAAELRADALAASLMEWGVYFGHPCDEAIDDYCAEGTCDECDMCRRADAALAMKDGAR